MRKNSKIFKFLIPGVISIILIVTIFIGTKFLPKQALGSIYNIDEAGTNFDNIQRGDTVNYEINGYSDWQVISKDDYNGTVDVVPKTNVEDLTLEYGQSKEYYEQKFQETANKYTDNNYAISARTVNREDLNYIEYDNSYWSDQSNDFWLNTINENLIQTSRENNLYQYTGEENYKIYVLPYIDKTCNNLDDYNVGDIIEYSNNGINRWLVVYKIDVNNPWYSKHELRLIPEEPIELVINGIDDKMDDKARQITDSFKKSGIEATGNYFEGTININDITNLMSNFLSKQTERIYYYSGNNNKKINRVFDEGQRLWIYENGEFKHFGRYAQYYTYTCPYTLGYRPVVTLKLKNGISANDEKEISNNLQVGDNVNYEANGYKNWKVLSIDKKE